MTHKFLKPSTALGLITSLIIATTTATSVAAQDTDAVAKENVKGKILGEFSGQLDGKEIKRYFLTDKLNGETINNSKAKVFWGNTEVELVAYKQSPRESKNVLIFDFILDDNLKLNSQDKERSGLTYMKSISEFYTLPMTDIQLTEVQQLDDETLKIKGQVKGTLTKPEHIKKGEKDSFDIDGEFYIDEVKIKES